jgi:protein-ribulosamine 3-kinase
VNGASTALATALAAAVGRAVEAMPAAEVHGGCINRCWRWETAGAPLFVKQAPAASNRMLEAERDGLEYLQAANAVRVPAVLGCGVAGDASFLVLEWITLRRGSRVSAERLGLRLAALHRNTGPRFGLAGDNFIGSTPQQNGWSDDWIAFLKERRLGFQLELAAENGFGGRLQQRGRQLLERLAELFPGYRPLPSLLHGDLWGGNWAADDEDQPVLFDPAVYYGDREAEIAMTRLFGGFGSRFYEAYDSVWPPDPGAGTRADLYNLYHVLNHLNLFGGSYRAQAEEMIERLLAAVGH